MKPVDICRQPLVAAFLGALLALALAGCSPGGGGNASGDVHFTSASMDATGESGHPAGAHMTLVSEAAKQNVYLRIDFYRLSEGETPSTIAVARPHEETSWHVWATHIETMEANLPLTVDASIDLPEGMATGRYAAVFSINAIDWFPGDDQLQGEESADLADNVFVQPTEVLVTRPDKPDLQVLSFTTSTFAVGPVEELEHPLTDSIMNASVEIISRTHDITEPFHLAFELGIDGEGGEVAWYPLNVALATNNPTEHPPTGRFEFPVRTHLVSVFGDPTGESNPVEAALVKNSPIGHSFHLFLTEEALLAVEALPSARMGAVRLTIDPDDVHAEWRDSESGDNHHRVEVMVFESAEAEPEPLAERGDGEAPAASPMFLTPVIDAHLPGIAFEKVHEKKDWSSSYGNDKANAYFHVNGTVSQGALVGGPITSGATIALADYYGDRVKVDYGQLIASTEATPLSLADAGNGMYRLYYGSTPVNYCRYFGPFSAAAFSSNKLNLVNSSIMNVDSCSALRFEDLNGGQLLSGDKVKLVGNIYGGDHYVNRVGGVEYEVSPFSTGGPETAFTITRLDGAGRENLRFTTNNAVLFDLFDKGFIALRVNGTANVDLDSQFNNFYTWRVEAFENVIQTGDKQFMTLPGGRTVLGVNEYKISRDKSKSKTFYPGGIPITVTLGASGTLGILNSAWVGPQRKMEVITGPYFDLDGYANAEVDAVVADAGVHIDLSLLYTSMPFTNAITVTPTAPRKVYSLSGQWNLETLSGDLYIYADTVAGCGSIGLSPCHWKDYLLSWGGYYESRQMFTPVTKSF